MSRKFTFISFVSLFLFSSLIIAQGLSDKEQLGKFMFFDTDLSDPSGLSCAGCHSPETGFTGESSITNNTTVVYPGAVNTRFGNRKPPTAAYGGGSPVMYHDTISGLFIGGMFWDGRATGWELGDPLSEQARGPFLNPNEQNLPSKEAFINIILASNYVDLFKAVYGNDVFNDSVIAYNKAADAISAYEKSSEVNPYTSKYDYYLKKIIELSNEEQKGLSLFEDKGKCDNCHLSKQGSKGEPPLFTDFTYDNLGIPKNPVYPFNTQPSDIGLGGFLETVTTYQEYAAENYGKHKVPTLRNVDKRPTPEFIKAYGHNGYFKSLKDIVHFYNTRDVEAWPPPEVPANVNTAELGNLELTSEDEDAIVAFLKTLSDGYILVSVDEGITDVRSDGKQILAQNTPNPFNLATQISFNLPEATYITLKVYNALGEEITTLINGFENAGLKSINFNASDLPSGIYYYRIQTDNLVETKKMILLK